jgi:SpoVK/Ycf46/Vps4 family AAA+-type ATPase
MNNQWFESSNNFFLREMSLLVDKLPVAIFKIAQTATGEIFLQKISDKFDMPAKLYGFESSFVKRSIKSFHSNEGNLGILLNGIKGTGKTVTAKMICNDINLPTIIITDPYPGLPDFINNLQQEVVVLFDEYEKMYKTLNDNDHSILTVMDGVLDNGFKRLFLLTTNKLSINENLLQRPGRILYNKTYGDLELECIKEIVDDLLIKKERYDSVVKFISELEIITVDIVKAVINEVNIHDEDPMEFYQFFNVKKVEESYNVFQIIMQDGQYMEALVYPRANISLEVIDDCEIGESFVVNGTLRGTILKTDTLNNTVIVEHKSGNTKIITTYRIEKYHFVHRSFQK